MIPNTTRASILELALPPMPTNACLGCGSAEHLSENCTISPPATSPAEPTATPETDARMMVGVLTDILHGTPIATGEEWVFAEHVRTLERALTASRAEVAELQTMLAQITPLKNSDIRLVIKLTTETQELRAEVAQLKLQLKETQNAK